MKRVDGFPGYENLQDGGFYLPVAKVDENGGVTDELVKQWESQVGDACTIVCSMLDTMLAYMLGMMLDARFLACLILGCR